MHNLKKITKYKLKFTTKPWIAPALQKSICIKIKLLKIILKRKTQFRKINFIMIIKSTEIVSPHSWKEANKIITVSILKAT